MVTFQNCATFGSYENCSDYDDYVDGVGDKHISWYNTLGSLLKTVQGFSKKM